MKKRYIILAIILLIFSTTKTYASCTQEELNEFKKIENEYKVTYEFNSDTKDYNITFYTPLINKFDYEIFTDINLNCKKINETEVKCYNVPINEYELAIVGMSNSCNDILKELTLKLPEYNIYSEDPLCEGIEEFYLCQPTYEKKVDRETFESRINAYKNTNQKQETEENEPPKENKISEYIKENLIQIIITIIFIILVIITIILTAKSIKESRRLE